MGISRYSIDTSQTRNSILNKHICKIIKKKSLIFQKHIPSGPLPGVPAEDDEGSSEDSLEEEDEADEEDELDDDSKSPRTESPTSDKDFDEAKQK